MEGASVAMSDNAGSIGAPGAGVVPQALGASIPHALLAHP